MLVKKVAIDLFGFDPNYVGGVSRFSIGLTHGLVNNLGVDNVVIIGSSKNVSYLKKTFPELDVIVVNVKLMDGYVFAAISILASLFRLEGMLRLSSFYRRFCGESKLKDYYIIVPTSTVNFFQLPCSLLCVHDIQHEVFPENFSRVVRYYRWAQYRLSAKHAELIQVSSNFIAENLRDYFSHEIYHKAIKIYEGYSKSQFALSLPKTRPISLGKNFGLFIYYPAQLWRHKNHRTVIEGLALFNKKTNLRCRLVLTGKNYGELENINRWAKECDVVVDYIGVVDDTEMRWLYSNSLAVISAGYHESSSLPIREAVACGGKVLAANIPPNREMLFLPSVRYFETFSVSSFFNGLNSCRDDGYDPLNSEKKFCEQNDLYESCEWDNVAKKYIWALNKLRNL